MSGMSKDPNDREAISVAAKRKPKSHRGCLTVFFLIFLIVGGVLFWLFSLRPLMLAWSARDWRPVPCTILSSELEEHHDSDSNGVTYRVAITYEYEVNGRSYRGDRYDFTSFYSSGRAKKQAIVDEYPPGAIRQCFVSPKDPAQSVINPNVTSDMFFGSFTLIFAVVGLVGLLFTTGVLKWKGRAKSRPRGADGYTDFVNREPFEEADRAATADSYAAHREDSSAGPVTLKPAGSPWMTVVGVLVFAAIWNGIVSVFVWQVVEGFQRGRPDWFLTIFMSPFVLVGLATVVFLVYSFLAAFNPRPVVTASTGQPRLGDTVRLSWRFQGQSSSLRRVTLTLVGAEEAHYRRGTQSYTDREEFCKMTIADTTNLFDMTNGEAEFTVPSSTMHSFATNNNKILWTINIHGEIGFWPDVNESFPVEIRPMADRKELNE